VVGAVDAQRAYGVIIAYQEQARDCLPPALADPQSALPFAIATLES
jgi:hypothetical protein